MREGGLDLAGSWSLGTQRPVMSPLGAGGPGAGAEPHRGPPWRCHRPLRASQPCSQECFLTSDQKPFVEVTRQLALWFSPEGMGEWTFCPACCIERVVQGPDPPFLSEAEGLSSLPRRLFLPACRRGGETGSWASESRSGASAAAPAASEALPPGGRRAARSAV